VAGALAAAANSSGINRLVVLKLNGTANLPPVVRLPRAFAPPRAEAPAEMVAQGRAIYERRCYVCHGSTAISGGEVPDLRYSGALGDAAAFLDIVRDGALASNGMPGFARDLDDRAVEAVRAYVIQRANTARDNPSGVP
jgi:mono/diheme cytochrome c family protein